MDNNNKLKLFRQESPKKYSDKRMILQNQSHINKKQSADLNLINSVYKSRNTQNNKLNKIPFNIRSTYQEKLLNPNLNFGNIESSNISGNKVIKVKDKGTPVKKDKNYYLNLLNDIYLNDSHYSNKNTVKSKIVIIIIVLLAKVLITIVLMTIVLITIVLIKKELIIKRKRMILK